MAEKYQIFVSSTFDDLKHERDRVIKGILELGHIPVGMEMFSAGDEEQWKIIARHIDESDYYVVIVAHRYGSIVDGISFTRKEFEYAVSKGVPVVGFIIDPDAQWPTKHVDTSAAAVQGLAAFKELVSSRPVGFWSNADDLYGKSSVALVKAFSAQPRSGWVRQTAAGGPEVAAELTRLSSENASLRKQIEEVSGDSEREYEAELKRDLETLRSAKQSISVRYVGGPADGWEQGGFLSLARVFEIVAPSLVVEGAFKRVSGLIALHAKSTSETRRVKAVPSNSVGQLLTDLMAFGLLAPSARRHAVSDKEAYWALTQRGVDLASHMTRMRLRAAAEPADDVDDSTAAAISADTE